MNYHARITLTHKELQALRVMLGREKRPTGYRAKLLSKVDAALKQIEAGSEVGPLRVKNG